MNLSFLPKIYFTVFIARLFIFFHICIFYIQYLPCFYNFLTFDTNRIKSDQIRSKGFNPPNLPFGHFGGFGGKIQVWGGKTSSFLLSFFSKNFNLFTIITVVFITFIMILFFSSCGYHIKLFLE